MFIGKKRVLLSKIDAQKVFKLREKGEKLEKIIFFDDTMVENASIANVKGVRLIENSENNLFKET